MEPYVLMVVWDHVKRPTKGSFNRTGQYGHEIIFVNVNALTDCLSILEGEIEKVDSSRTRGAGSL